MRKWLPRLQTSVAEDAERHAQVDQLRETLSDAQIRAPFDGTIAARYVEPGTTPTSGIETLATSRSNKSFDEWILPRNAGSREHFLNLHRLRRGPQEAARERAHVRRVRKSETSTDIAQKRIHRRLQHQLTQQERTFQ